MNSSRKTISVFFIVMIFILTGNISAEPIKREYAIKAAFIYNFAKFITWPEPYNSQKTLTLCILGKDPFGEKIWKLFRGKEVKGHLFRIKRISSLMKLQDCQILYISNSETYRLRRILKEVNRKTIPVLTVGDNKKFLKYGGIINLYKYKNKIRFEINNNIAKKKGLKISAKLLRLARTNRGRYEKE